MFTTKYEVCVQPKVTANGNVFVRRNEVITILQQHDFQWVNMVVTPRGELLVVFLNEQEAIKFANLLGDW